jgi:lipopolysaccharide heptosyltransferase II
VLAVRLDPAGDLLMTTPALRALTRLPGRPRITLLTSHAGAAIARLIPEVNEVIPYAAPWMKAAAEPGCSADLEVLARLRATELDAAVIFTVYGQSPWPAALFCHLAGIPLRLAHGRENPYHLLSDWVTESEPGRGVRHEVARQLELVAKIGAPIDDRRLSLRVPEAARTAMRARLASLGVGPDDGFVLIHPGASAPSRRYPSERYAEVAGTLVRQGLRVLVVGAPDDAPAIDDVARVAGTRYVGAADLASLSALIAAASVVVANNSSPAHIAAALGTPVVVLYALTNPQHAPWSAVTRVLFRTVACAFCYKSVCPQGHHDCLRKVAPHEVVGAVHDLLGTGVLPLTGV